MLAKRAAVAGTVIGWGLAAGSIFLPDPSRNDILAQAFALAVGMISVAWLMVCSRSRPMSAAFELGYEMGRRDVIVEVNRPRKVTPIREYVEQRERDAVG